MAVKNPVCAKTAFEELSQPRTARPAVKQHPSWNRDGSDWQLAALSGWVPERSRLQILDQFTGLLRRDYSGTQEAFFPQTTLGHIPDRENLLVCLTSCFAW